ncbi:MAG: zinc-dependent metalloprotease [Bacteroidetes bacterium]|jgi:hypothetical protein|nr:zinc-dependent metalloprotease [Bacteroidota bacterium]MBT3751717.1 zinc-dependent metalloprotease [Bacteroidota bacterium]MBT4399971.1 zinc-dependent metalloprotease [Bacteroidota bacterium]MBT4409077.1 zinc-dependent metalloprotease [Bacteroidota bacterium]MBT7093456.1 zinc-dependent metalloprotease [Bacteroidota bacterium]
MSTFRKFTLLFVGLSLLLLNSVSFGQDTSKTDKKSIPKPKFKPYAEIIPDSTVTKKGVFITHEVDGKIYYEIPDDQLGQEYLWLVQFSKTQTSFGYGGTEVIRRVVRWERFRDQILLRNVEYQMRADEGSSEEIAVKASSLENIIQAFKIETFGTDSTPVINVTALFTGDIHEFSPKKSLKASSVDKNRTFITSVKSFESNIETRVLSTFKLKPAAPSTPGARPTARHSDSSLGSVTVELHHSMVQLPEKMMLPRIYDKRVGIFAGTHQDYSSDRNQVENITYIRRWRLEKKDPAAEVSEPVKPIIYYVGRGIPEKWQQYVKEGIEMWQPVFEKAGFKNAIIGKMAPSLEDDPDFDAEDVRYSTVRWLPSTIANAYGPHVQDPRSGEILEADVRIYHNVISLIRDWYFVQASPSDTRAQKLPLPDDIIGDCLRYVVAHEVGHTIGLRHNFKSTYYYPVEKYRSKKFTEKYGLEASIMDYGRFNYIAQPGDDAATIPIIAPYDYFAIEWAYREFNGTGSPEEDVPYLNKIAQKQVDNPMFRFGGGYEMGLQGGSDPHARSEDLGDDPIKATSYGLKNIEYITGYLVEACGEEGKDYTLLQHMYDALLSQMNRELNHVAALIGGIELDNWMYGQSSEVFTPTPVKEQKAALSFILEKGFKTPDYLLKKDVVTRLGMHGMAKKISTNQKRLLSTMMNTGTATRILDLEATGFECYPLVELVTDLKDGIFEELYEKDNDVNLFRRNLQRSYVEQLIAWISTKTATKNDLQAIARGTLKSLRKDIQDIPDADTGSMDYFHYNDLEEMIELALDGK